MEKNMKKNTLSSVDKICQETDCSDKMIELDQDQKEFFKKFTYCPFCAEEMTLICNSCHEQLTSSEFKFCPWCGAEFSI